MLASGGNVAKLRSSYRVRFARGVSHHGGDCIRRYSSRGHAISSAQAGIATQTLGSDVHAHPLRNFYHLVSGLDDLASYAGFQNLNSVVRPHVFLHPNGLQMAWSAH